MANKNFNWEILSLTRFLLAFIVMVGHLRSFTSIGVLNWYALLGSFEAILGFLLISGLSIGKSISKNQDSYFKRRIQRIYPVYLASIVLELALMPHEFSFQFFFILLLNLVFLNQVFTNTSFVGPSWTLATEVWLYSLAPFFLKLSLRNIFIIIYLSFACYCVYTCGRSLYHWNYYSGTRYGINLILLAYIWLAGFALAIFPLSKKFVSVNIAFIFVAYLGLLIAIQCGFRYKHHELNQIVPKDLPGFIGKILCLCWVYFVVIYNHKIPHFSLSVHKVFNLLGNISYPLYLVHETLFNFLHRFHISNLFVLMTVALASSFVIYWLFDFYSKKRVIK